MNDRYQTEAYDPFGHEAARRAEPPPVPPRQHPPLPAFLMRRWLRENEQVTWVVGTRFNPSWEQYVTHPGLFFVALACGVLAVVTGRFTAASWGEMSVWPALAAFVLVVGSVIVLGLSCGYFTRLVVTNQRLLLGQGRELYRKWDIDRLPRSLIRYGRRDRGEDAGPLIDLDALQTMLGSKSDQFADAKTILALGKQLGQIKAREDRRP